MDKLNNTTSKKLALIGAGGMSIVWHIPALLAELKHRAGKFELVAIVEPDLGRLNEFRQKFECKYAFSSIEEMLGTVRPDAALAITPYWLNAKIAAELIEHDISVLMEKPPGINSTEFQQLIKLSNQTDRILQVGFNRRHWPAMRRAQEWLQEDGEPLQYLRGTKHRTGRVNEDYPFFTSIHVIDNLLNLGGTPLECTTARVPIPGDSRSFNYLSTIIFANGCIAHASALPDVSFNQEIYEMHTRAGTIVVNQKWSTDDDAEIFKFHGTGLIRHEIFPKCSDRLRVDGFLGQIRTFLDALEGHGEPYPTVDQCAHVISISEAIREGRTWRNEA